MFKKYNTILFDLDGTLIDSKEGIVDCIGHALNTKNVEYTNDIIDKMIGPPFRVSMKEFLGLDGDTVEELISLYRGKYEISGWKQCRVYDGVVELLKKLKNDGFTLATATSKPLKYTNYIIDGQDLRKYFDYIGGATGDNKGEAKSDVINSVFKNLDIKDKSKVLMIGDRLYDIEGAKVCGIDSAGILWGYGSREELEEYNADYIFETPNDVYEFLTKDC